MSEFTITPVAGQVAAAGNGQNARDALNAALRAALRHPRFEVLPLVGTAELVEQHLSHSIPVTVTASPRQGLEPTLVVTEALARLGFPAVPHVAARLIVDESHLVEVLHRLDEAGVRDVFVVGGDGDRPVGCFRDALTLLTAIQRLRNCGVGTSLEQVGITGYPEGHPLVSDRELIESLAAKQSLATYAVTQMCFDATAVSRWVSRVRRDGITLPVHVGVAGKIDRRRLMRISARIGLGDSARFLRKHRHGWTRLLLPGIYHPDRLVRDLGADLARPSRGVAGLHVYTLGAVAATEQWRRQALVRLGDDGLR
ncbi:MAG: methylenetetrahydrofolate reductase [Actinomycetota bacterium]|nr:methylenetetrahydrofolate reductase [Actinomycetota bacterium]